MKGRPGACTGALPRRRGRAPVLPPRTNLSPSLPPGPLPRIRSYCFCAPCAICQEARVLKTYGPVPQFVASTAPHGYPAPGMAAPPPLAGPPPQHQQQAQFYTAPGVSSPQQAMV